MSALLRACSVLLVTTTAACAARSPTASTPPAQLDPAAESPTGWDDARIGPPFVVANFEQTPRSNGDLLRTPTLHVAMDDLRRLRIISGFQEVRLGLLRVAAGDQFESGSSVAYNFGR